MVPRPRWLDQARDHDVLCCVKRFISDGEWAQLPVVVLPQGGLARLATHLPSEAVSRVVHADASDKWRKAAVFVQGMVAVNPVYLRAIEYLTSLADGTCADGAALPALSWHSQDSVPGLALPIVPLGLQGALLPAVPFSSAWKR